ncbi:hypothetical protein PENSPDRAFT_362288 [Peniophora sp. CONT]|nr:hypothetical protein PENSPDRAFT_362288 [Peniophora sp. CONT]
MNLPAPPHLPTAFVEATPAIWEQHISPYASIMTPRCKGGRNVSLLAHLKPGRCVKIRNTQRERRPKRASHRNEHPASADGMTGAVPDSVHRVPRRSDSEPSVVSDLRVYSKASAWSTRSASSFQIVHAQLQKSKRPLEELLVVGVLAWSRAEYTPQGTVSCWSCFGSGNRTREWSTSSRQSSLCGKRDASCRHSRSILTLTLKQVRPRLGRAPLSQPVPLLHHTPLQPRMYR